MASEDLTLSGHIAFLRKYAIELRALARQSTPKIATTMTQAIRNAPTRVNNPSSTRIPPISSPNAAAPIHNHAGRMNGNGTAWDNDVHFAQPGPLNEPSTFCAPCPMKATPITRRSGTVAQVEEVEVSLRSMIVYLS